MTMIRPSGSKKAQVRTSCWAWVLSLLRWLPAAIAHADKIPQAVHAWVMSVKSFETTPCRTYQDGADNYDLAAGQLSAMLHRPVVLSICGTNGRRPMHARNCTRKQASTNAASPPTICPGSSPSEEDSQGGGTRKNGDDGRPDDVGNFVGALVVGDAQLANVMHPAN